MKLKLPFLFLIILVFSCKENKNDNFVEKTDDKSERLDVTTSIYPKNLSKVFDAHGGLSKWNEMQTLTFTVAKESGDEITTTDLKNRKSLIQMPKHSIGFDGEHVWITNNDETEYKGDPKFYYNLMFYFYAMPFVIADDGIIYEDIEPLKFEGNNYPGIKISYQTGVGESPDDEYLMYYDKDSNKMVWLGYTVTYFTEKKSQEFHFIKYSDWQNINGLMLPKTLTWYSFEGNKPTKRRRDLVFTDIVLSKDQPNQQVFDKPKVAVTVK